jgi:hypothetical protein
VGSAEGDGSDSDVAAGELEPDALGQAGDAVRAGDVADRPPTPIAPPRIETLTMAPPLLSSFVGIFARIARMTPRVVDVARRYRARP